MVENGPVNESFRRRAEQRELAAEGSLWPVVGALLASAVLGTAIGWLVLSRANPPGSASSMKRDLLANVPALSLPVAEVDQRQQLLSRLRALQVNQSWFLQLVDESSLARSSQRGGGLPVDASEDAPLHQLWNDLAEEWLARIEQLKPQLRSRLGDLENNDWQKQRKDLMAQGVNARVVEQLVTAGAQNLLPGAFNIDKPAEPYLQLWYAAALRSLADLQIEMLETRPSTPTVFSTRVSPGGARLISIRVQPGHRLLLSIKGSPLMQMIVYSFNGDVVAERGALRVVNLPLEAGSPVQVLVTNEGVATGLLTLSCRVDQQVFMSLPALDPDPKPDSATGALYNSEQPSITPVLPSSPLQETLDKPTQVLLAD
ncbi:MAG: hypothetical protein AB8A40_09305 [Prochlorococcus sp.]